jgi:hypothetical protein
MSNKKITDLTELTTPTTDDVFPIVDIATNTTQKVQVGNLPIQTAVTTALATKQATLVSGTNIKTVNSTTLLGSGDIAVQPTLVSGTNIKTINSTSLLGSGDIAVVTSPSGVAGAIQFSNGSAFASDAANLFWDDTNNRLGVGTNAPANNLSVIDSTSGSTSGDKGITVGNSNTAQSLRFGSYFNIGIISGPSGPLMIQTPASNKGVSISTGYTIPSGMLHIVGSGSTSATTSLLVQNSAGVSSLQVKDDGSVFNYGKGAISSNCAFGEGAIFSNTSGTQITAFGTNSLSANSTGVRNTAFGNAALTSTSTGSSNNAFGFRSLVLNTGGGNNTAMGDLSLERTTVSNNTAFGSASLQNTSTGSGNVGVGANALNANTTGSNNSALGFNTASGNFSGSVILGNDATATASNQFVVGSSTTNAGAVNSTSDVPATFLWSVRINGTNYKILMTT